MNLPPQQRPRAGFTLIEVVISAGLMALILTSAYACLNAAVAGRKLVEPRAEIFQNARVAMDRLTADLRSACPLATNYDFLGARRRIGDIEAGNLDFATHNYTPRRDREGDYCQVSYYVEPNQQTGQFSLWRRRNARFAPDPLSGGTREEIATGLVGARFEYYDGLDWYDSWGDETGKASTSQRDHPNLQGMPEAVRVTLLFDSNPKPKSGPAAPDAKPEPPLVFQTVAALNLADRPGSSTSSDANQQGSQSTPQSQPGQGGGSVF